MILGVSVLSLSAGLNIVLMVTVATLWRLYRSSRVNRPDCETCPYTERARAAGGGRIELPTIK